MKNELIGVEIVEEIHYLIKNSKDLEKLQFTSGDQVRVRYTLSSTELTTWPEEQEKIKKWAAEKGVLIASTEAVLVGDGIHANSSEDAHALELMKPDEIVREFTLSEKLSEDVIQVGLEIVKSV